MKDIFYKQSIEGWFEIKPQVDDPWKKYEKRKCSPSKLNETILCLQK